MLVLTRKVDEGILIGDNIVVKVIAVEGNKVKLGISADKNVAIIREEIVTAVSKENLSAGLSLTGNPDWSITAPTPPEE